MQESSHNVRVVVRGRPIVRTREELEEEGGAEVGVRRVQFDPTENKVTVPLPYTGPYTCTLDQVYDCNFTNTDIFRCEVLPLVDAVLEGFNCTVFAYGQSGSGKTHTLSLPPGNTHPGLLWQALSYMFTQIERESINAHVRYKVSCQILEIYQDKLKDLLNNAAQASVRLARDRSRFYAEAETVDVNNFEAALNLVKKANQVRTISSTQLNTHSSRAHTLYRFNISSVTTTGDDGQVITATLNMVDLAGSERANYDGTPTMLAEGCSINRSLSTLGIVIDALASEQKYIPYRSSVLTMLLKNALGGNSKTVLFATVRLGESHIWETLSTLRFAHRCTKVKTAPMRNMAKKDALIAALSAEVKELRKQIETMKAAGHNADWIVQEQQLQQTIADLKMQHSQELQGRKADNLSFREQIADLNFKISQMQKTFGSVLQDNSVDISNTDVETCPVCLEPTWGVNADLPCNHAVHPACLTAMWNNGLRKCPLCRVALTAQNLQTQPNREKAPPPASSGSGGHWLKVVRDFLCSVHESASALLIGSPYSNFLNTLSNACSSTTQLTPQTASAAFKSICKAVSHAHGAVVEFSQQLASAEQQRDTNSTTLEEARQSVDQLNRQHRALQETVAELEQAATEWKVRYQVQLQKNKEMKETHKTLECVWKDKLAQTEAKVTRHFLDQLATQQAEHDAKRQEQKQAFYQELAAQRQEWRQKVRALEEELDDVELKHSDATVQLIALSAAYAELKGAG